MFTPQELTQIKKLLDQSLGVATKNLATNETVEKLRDEVGTLKKDVGSVKKDVALLKQDVGTVREELGSVKKDVGTMQKDVGAVKKDVGEQKEALKSLKEEVADLRRQEHTHHLATKAEIEELHEKVNHLPTKPEYYAKQDEVIGQLKASREEEVLLSGKVSEHTDVIEDHEVRIKKIEKRMTFS